MGRSGGCGGGFSGGGFSSGGRSSGGFSGGFHFGGRSFSRSYSGRRNHHTLNIGDSYGYGYSYSHPKEKAISYIICVIVILITLAGVVLSSDSDVPTSTYEREALPATAAKASIYYIDDDGDWVFNDNKMTDGMKYFYDKTGVWPFVHIFKNGSVTSIQTLEELANDDYNKLFNDDAHFVLAFCDNNSGGYYCGWTGGALTKTVMDDEAVNILAAYLEKNYEYASSEEEIFSETFRDTANRIMTVTPSPFQLMIPIFAIVGVVIIAFIIFILIRKHQKNEEEKNKTLEEVLNKPLETFGDSELEALEEKYEKVEPKDKEQDNLSKVT